MDQNKTNKQKVRKTNQKYINKIQIQIVTIIIINKRTKHTNNKTPQTK